MEYYTHVFSDFGRWDVIGSGRNGSWMAEQAASAETAAAVGFSGPD